MPSNTLPSSKVNPNKPAKLTRNIIHWFIPTMGIVKMYVNPDQIQYSYRKNIVSTQTKSGWTAQYLGEQLPKLAISGTTGTAGVEGINVLYELYRAEQFAFDNMGTLISSLSSGPDVTKMVMNSASSTLDMLAGSTGISDSIKTLTGASSTTLPVQNMMTLADVAFGVEMYYSGWIFRGYFEDFSITERADNFLFNYSMNFVVTQKRGYRYNYLPWHRSPNNGESAYSTPYSFSKTSKFIPGR
jgi:hypothetical protein